MWVKFNKLSNKVGNQEYGAYLLFVDGVISEISNDRTSLTVTTNKNETYILVYSDKTTFTGFKCGDYVSFGYAPYDKTSNKINIYNIKKI